jgi:RNA polymerase sigma-70 factor (ECF subfamily)
MPDLDRSTHADVRSAPSPGLEESEVVRRAQLGSSAAFDQLVLRYGPDIYRFLFVRLRNESDARDALQETMAAVWQALPALRQPDRFWPWLVSIATRKASAASRRRGPAHERILDSPSEDDGDALEVWDAVGRLPARYRDVLVLRYRLELSEDETAHALGVRVGTVKSRSARARKALMELLR